MSAIDFIELQTAVESATRQAIDELLARDKNICAFSLYSDSDASTICTSANTLAHLKKMQAADPGDALYYKFSPAEWQYEAVAGNEEFGKINAILKRSRTSNDAERRFFKNSVYETCMKALEVLRPEYGENILFLFSVSDSEISADIEISRAARLNNQRVVEEFRTWTKEWAD